MNRSKEFWFGQQPVNGRPLDHLEKPMKNASVPKPGILPARPTLSVCMIVRDEEKVLARCLRSVVGVSEELIVVDTGSRDNTVSIAKGLGARVFRFAWCDDFAAARNESLKHATGDWILQIDADEALLSDSISPLRKTMSDPWCLLCNITIDNGPRYPDRFFKPGRLFRNHPEILYSRPYHETVRSSVRKLRRCEPGWQIVDEPKIVVRHYGWDECEMKERGKFARELRILESYLKGTPEDHRMATRLAEVYICVGRWDDAIRTCKRTLAVSPFYPPAHHALGAAYLEKGMLEEAIASLKQAIDLDPDFGLAHYRLGCAYCSKGMFDEGISKLDEALAKEPNLALAHYWLGAAYSNKGMFDEAIVAFKQALAIDPDVDDMLLYNLAKAHTNRGVAYHRKGMLDEAIDAYRQAVAVNPGDTEPHFNLAIAYKDKGMLEEAVKKYKDVLRVKPQLALAHSNLATLYYLKGEHSLAVKHCNEAIELGLKVDSRLLKNLRSYRGKNFP
jgi:tetratricopeptide (TPR) repeat protein